MLQTEQNNTDFEDEKESSHPIPVPAHRKEIPESMEFELSPLMQYFF